MQIVETIFGSVNVLESKKAGVIGRFKALLGKNNYTSLNGYYYPDNFWNKVIASEDFKNKLERKLFLGSLDHPVGGDGRISTLSSVVILDKVYMEGDDLYGEFDIIDCDGGRFLYNLLKYGVKLGVSLRASAGSSDKRLNPDDIIVMGWDVVKEPSVAESSIVLTEEFYDSMKVLYNSCKSGKVKNIINYIFESKNSSNFVNGRRDIYLEEYRKLKVEFEELKSKYNKLMNEKRELEECIIKVRDSNRVYEGMIKERDEVIEGLRNKVNEYERIIEEKDSEISDLKSKIYESFNKDKVMVVVDKDRISNMIDGGKSSIESRLSKILNI